MPYSVKTGSIFVKSLEGSAAKMKEIKKFTMGQLIDEFTYSNYAINRKTMTAEQLGRCFPTTGAAMEARWQSEQQEVADANDEKRVP